MKFLTITDVEDTFWPIVTIGALLICGAASLVHEHRASLDCQAQGAILAHPYMSWGNMCMRPILPAAKSVTVKPSNGPALIEPGGVFNSPGVKPVA